MSSTDDIERLRAIADADAASLSDDDVRFVAFSLDAAPSLEVQREAIEAARALAGAARGDWVLPAIRAVASEDAGVRCVACGILGDLRVVEAIRLIGEMLMKDADVTAQCCAAEALGAIGHPDAVPLLVAGAADPAPSVRGWSVLGLGLCAAPVTEDLTELLRRIAATDADDAVRTEAWAAGLRLGVKTDFLPGPTLEAADEKLLLAMLNALEDVLGSHAAQLAHDELDSIAVAVQKTAVRDPILAGQAARLLTLLSEPAR